MPFDPAFCMHICNTFICICAYSAMPTTYMLTQGVALGYELIGLSAQLGRQIITNKDVTKNNTSLLVSVLLCLGNYRQLTIGLSLYL